MDLVWDALGEGISLIARADAELIAIASLSLLVLGVATALVEPRRSAFHSGWPCNWVGFPGSTQLAPTDVRVIMRAWSMFHATDRPECRGRKGRPAISAAPPARASAPRTPQAASQAAVGCAARV